MKEKYDKFTKKYGYEFEKKVRFAEKFRDENYKAKISSWKYILSKNIRFYYPNAVYLWYDFSSDYSWYLYYDLSTHRLSFI